MKEVIEEDAAPWYLKGTHETELSPEENWANPLAIQSQLEDSNFCAMNTNKNWVSERKDLAFVHECKKVSWIII